MKDLLNSFLSKMVPVIMSILIALFVNNWKADLDNQRFIKRAFDSIEQEITENKSSVEDVLERHLVVLDSFQSHIESTDLSLVDIIAEANGVQYPVLKSTAWKFYAGHNIELIEYQTISMLSEIDESKRLMDIKFDKLMDFVYVNMNKTDSETKNLFIIHLSNVVDSEQQLDEQYAAFLDMREQAGNIKE
jgi:hypothetical protein